MQAQDQALLTMSAVGFLASVVFYFYRRNAGSSRALATVCSIWSFGLIIAFGFLFGFIPVSSRGIGLERIVVPFITLIVTAVASAIIGMLVSFIEGRKADHSSISSDEFDDSRTPQPGTVKFAPVNPAWPAWKKFAFEAARKPN